MKLKRALQGFNYLKLSTYAVFKENKYLNFIIKFLWMPRSFQKIEP